MDTNVVEELLFFDTFSHDASEEINLDLVQFPKPVIISEVRIIPLGARVQADFPGGVRLGATNPSQFHIEFFVNDLSKPGASTFESLGALEYRQTSDIQFQCGQKKIPTDGLVLRGWYTTITLAVYGALSKGIPPAPPDPRTAEISSSAATAEWVQSQQAAMFLDTGYNYPPPDFPTAAPEIPYAESWASGPPPTGPSLGHNEPYDGAGKDYVSQPNWEPPPEEIKPWKEDLVKSGSPIRTGSSGGDSVSKSRHRSDYWDERDERKERRRRDDDGKRFKDIIGKDDDRRSVRSPAWRDTEPRRVIKGAREDSWDREREREKSPHSETSSYRRRPKSPPSRSPKRPYTPTERFWSPERREYRSPTGRYSDERRRSSPLPRPSSPVKVVPRTSDQLRVDVYAGSPQTPLQSPAGTARPPVDDRCLDEEQFEPILSDEDIVDEPESQFPDMDFDVTDDLEDIVKPFNPFTFVSKPLENFPNPASTSYETPQGIENTEELLQLKQLLPIPMDVTIDWVSAVEQLPPLLFRVSLTDSTDKSLKTVLIQWMEFGLNLDQALGHATPGAKLRHIKAGIRLCESLCQIGLIEDLVRGGIHKQLLQLFHREQMALSIRLQILQALDSTLLDHAGMESFLNDKWELEVSGTAYQHILTMLASKQQVRVKFALTALLQKVHTYEVLSRLNEMTSMLIAEKEVDDREVVLCLQAINRVYVHAGTLLSQPRRFLPVQAQFEVRIDSRMAYLFLYRCFRDCRLLESILVHLTSKRTGQAVLGSICELLYNISDHQHGLQFLAASTSITNGILKALQTTDDYPDQNSGCPLALQLAFRLCVINSLDKLLDLKEEGDIFNVLHDLFCLSFSPGGKIHLAFVLSLADNLSILLRFVDLFGKKSAVYGYVTDLASITIKYSDKTEYMNPIWRTLLELGLSDPQCKLSEVTAYIQPLEVFTDDITVLCDILKKQSSSDICGAVPGEFITTVRLLQHVCVPPYADLPSEIEGEGVNYRELRYKHAALQLFSLDGLANITSILTKILEHYEQPFAHTATLLGSNGISIVSFIEPAIVLMRVMLSLLIEARGTEYKDLTHVNVLLEVYTLMQAIPNNAEVQGFAQRISRHIVETLLAYTQPTVQTDSYGKSLWSLMLSDVLKFIMKAPYCFIPGFSLLSELLPLPLPIQTTVSPTADEASALRSARQLWSAHVHPLAAALHDLFAAMAGGSFAPLLQLVRRVAVQLADLAAPTALILARAVIDPLLATLARPDEGWELPVSPHATRLLHFLACLVPHPSFKVAILSLITPGANARTDERLLTLVDAFTTILRTPGSSPCHSQAQEYVVLIMHTLLDPEISLVSVGADCSRLPNALPARDLLITMVSALLDHASTQDNPLPTLLLSLKPLILLTDHDYGFYHLKATFEAKPESVFSVLLRLSSDLTRDHTDALNAIHGTLALLREMVLDAPTPMRTLTMTAAELSRVVRWEDHSESSPHPLHRILTSLKEWSSTDEALNNLCESAGDLVKLLSNCESNVAPASVKDEEYSLPPALPLMEQFGCRPVFVPGEPELKSLSSAYWLSVPPPEDADQDSDLVPCDLLDLSRNLLPDLHLPQEVLRICRLKPQDIDDDGKKQEPSKYQLSGIRSRRPFVAPMRGRGGRPAPQRGDLFRSRPPNTSRPPSLHVDDFVALETCGQQPTGPTGYNKVSVRNVKEVIATRARGRGRVFGSAPYPRRDSPRSGSRGRGSWGYDDLRSQPTSRLRTWQAEDLRRIHPFPR